jgi:hypothetical protein
MGERQFLSEQEQHGSVGEVEQCICRGEHKERPAFEKHVPSCGFFVVTRAAAVDETSRAVMVDGMGGKRQDGEASQDCKKWHEIEDGTL